MLQLPKNFRFIFKAKAIQKTSLKSINVKCPAEPPKIENDNVLEKEKLDSRLRREQNTIYIQGQTCTKHINCFPPELRKTRKARIYRPAKNVMQSGTENTRLWAVDFNRDVQWENPLVGWCSSNDVLSGVRVFFKNRDDAIAFCEKEGWQWWIQETWSEKEFKPKSYGINFDWKRRTRVSTK